MQPLTADQTMHRCQWVCHEHAVCHWGGPPPPALGPGKQRAVIVHRRHWRLSYLFLGFLNVSVSVAYYFYLNLIIWLISDSWTWMSFGNFVGHVTHYLGEYGGEEERALLSASHCFSLFSSHLCGCCLTAPLTTAAAVVVEPVCQQGRTECVNQPGWHHLLAELPSAFYGAHEGVCHETVGLPSPACTPLNNTLS